MSPTRRRWPYVLAAVGVLVVGGVAVGIARRPPPATVTVARHTLEEAVEVSGTVQAARAVTLKAAAAGTVARRLVPENADVAAGTPLLSLDAAQLALQRDQARTTAATNRAQAETALRNARATLAEVSSRQRVTLENSANQVAKARQAVAHLAEEAGRAATLTREGALSDQALAQARQQLSQARLDLRLAEDNPARTRTASELVAARNAVSQAETARANALAQGDSAVKLAEKGLADAVTKAPFRGTLTAWEVDAGAWVIPGMALATFQDLAVLRVRLPVDELDLPKIKAGGGVALKFDAYPDADVQGKITQIGRASTPVAGSNVQVFPVEVSFPNPDGRIKPGMSVDAHIKVSERVGVLAVPLGAVRRVADRTVVSVLKGGTPTDVPIEPGLATLTELEVKSGLAEGDLVVFAAASPSPKP